MKRVLHFVARFYRRIGTAGRSRNERLLPNKEFVYVGFNSYEASAKRSLFRQPSSF